MKIGLRMRVIRAPSCEPSRLISHAAGGDVDHDINVVWDRLIAHITAIKKNTGWFGQDSSPTEESNQPIPDDRPVLVVAKLNFGFLKRAIVYSRGKQTELGKRRYGHLSFSLVRPAYVQDLSFTQIGV